MNRRLVALALFLGAAFIFVPRLGSKGFWNNHSETQRAEVSREMVASGNWIVPYLNGETFATKPPLGYWLMALSIKFRGIADEVSARIPSVIVALLGVIVTFWAGSRYFGFQAGLLSGALLATGPLWVWYGRQAGIDMPFAFFTSASFLFFLDGRRWTWLLGSVLFGLAVLAKPPALWVVPAPLLIATLGKNPALRWNWRKVGGTALITLAIILPWGVALHHHLHGLTRIAESQALNTTFAVPESNRKPVYFYLITLLAASPFALFLPKAFQHFRQGRNTTDPATEKALWIYVFLNVAIFSCGLQKKNYYLLPIMPGLAVLLGASLASDSIGRSRRVLWGLAGALALVLVTLPLSARIIEPEVVRASVPFTIVTALAAAAVFSQARRSRHGAAISILTLTAFLLSWFLWVYAPALDRFRSRKEFLLETRPIVGTNDLYLFDYASYDAPYYLERIIPEVKPDDLARLAAETKPVYLLSLYRLDTPVATPGFSVVREHEYRPPRSRHAPRKIALLVNEAGRKQ